MGNLVPCRHHLDDTALLGPEEKGLIMAIPEFARRVPDFVINDIPAFAKTVPGRATELASQLPLLGQEKRTEESKEW